MKTTTLFLVLLAMFAGHYCKPAEEDYYSDPPAQADDGDDFDEDDYGDNPDDNLEGSKLPLEADHVGIITKPIVRHLYEGDNFTLPCETNSTFEEILIWKKGNTGYFQSKMRIEAPPNVYADDKSITVTNFQKKDEGDYICSVTVKGHQPSVTHHLIYAAPEPAITLLAAKDNITVLSAGSTLVLECRATGNPPPQISWHKGSERLGTEGSVLTIRSVKVRDAGMYRCLADNKMFDPAAGSIDIKVEFKPIVTLEELFVNTEQNMDAELKCVVHAEPPAGVNWQKEGMNIRADDRRRFRTEGRNHILIIKNIQETDFGNYSCFASNSLGQTVKHTELVKTPAILNFVDPPDNKEPILTWKVQSKSPISEHELQYVKKGGEDWETVIPEVIDEDKGSDIYTVKYIPKNLEPGTYETRLRSKNKHGWSRYSENMSFSKEHPKHGHHKHHKKGHKDAKVTDIITPPESKQDSKHPENEVPAEHQFEDTRTGAAATDGSATATWTTSLLSIILIVSVCVRQ